jgi:hypothetical protein
MLSELILNSEETRLNREPTPPRKPNWHEIKRAYVCGEPVDRTSPDRRFPTLRELESVCGIEFWKIGKRAKREGWLDLRAHGTCQRV